MNDSAPRPLLVIEDSDEDFATLQRLIEEQVEERNVRPGPVYRCHDGDEALDFLFREGKYADSTLSPCPRAILLDLNLPGTDGREILRQLKQDEGLQQIPAIVFTTSNNPADIEYCYRIGADGYLLKPIDLTALKQTVEAFTNYWLGANLPPSMAA